MSKGYGEDLAYIHDADYGDLSSAAADFLLGKLRDKGRVVDLGCGSGVLAQRLAAAGCDVLGIDRSAAMIALARRRAPQARFRRASVWTADLPSCVAVTAVGECFNYLFDRDHSERDLKDLFGRIYDALANNGYFLFDIACSGRRTGRHGAAGEDWAAIVNAEASDGILTRRIISFRKVGRLYRRSCEIHRLRLLDHKAITQQLRAVGFRVRPVRKYGAVTLDQGQIGFLARKP